MAEFGERFFREIVSRDRKDITIARRYFDKSIVPAIGSKRVGEVTTEDVRAIIWRKKDEGFDAAAGMCIAWAHATGRWRRRRSACC